MYIKLFILGNFFGDEGCLEVNEFLQKSKIERINLSRKISLKLLTYQVKYH
jgi:hypothetical protein